MNSAPTVSSIAGSRSAPPRRETSSSSPSSSSLRASGTCATQGRSPSAAASGASHGSRAIDSRAIDGRDGAGSRSVSVSGSKSPGKPSVATATSGGAAGGEATVAVTVAIRASDRDEAGVREPGGDQQRDAGLGRLVDVAGDREGGGELVHERVAASLPPEVADVYERGGEHYQRQRCVGRQRHGLEAPGHRPPDCEVRAKDGQRREQHRQP